MRINLDARDRRALSIAAGLFALFVLAGLVFAPDVDSNLQIPTTYSAASGGAKAAWLLLRESGYSVERWERSPADLPADPTHVVLVIANPDESPGQADIRAVRRFVAAGGRVIATGMQSAPFFPDVGYAGQDTARGEWRTVPAVALSPITRAAPRITSGVSGWWTSKGAGTPVYADDGKTHVLEVRVGNGSALLWASATPLTNAGLREPGNLEFLLACLGPRDSVHVLWDEYFHGHRQSLVASTVRSSLGWLLLQAGVIAAAVLWTYSRRSGPVRAVRGESRLSPLEFVRTLGHLYERAGAAAVAVDVTCTRVRYLLTRRLGLPPDAAPASIERAVREHYGRVSPGLGATLEMCEKARDRQDVGDTEALRLVRSLHHHAAELELYDRPAVGGDRRSATRRT